MKRSSSFLVMKRVIMPFAALSALLLVAQNVVAADSLQSGADRLTALQNNDGGWDYPLDNGTPATGTAMNTVGTIGTGLAQAYLQTNDPNHRAALAKVGSLLLTKTNNFGGTDGELAKQLDGIFGGSTYMNYVTTNFYDKLANGTYVGLRAGKLTTYTTASWINSSLTGNPGYAGWDLGLDLAGAKAAGVDTTLWVQGTKDALNQLNDGTSGQYYALDLAGGIYGLAKAGETSFTGSGAFAGVTGLSGLVTQLDALQLGNGAFKYATDDVAPDMQTSAYAILALCAADRAGHLASITNAAAYIESYQRTTGGFGDEYTVEANQLTGDALRALGTVAVTPEPATMSLLVLGGLAILRKRRNK